METDDLQRDSLAIEDDEWVTVSVAAARLGLDEATLVQWCEEGRLAWQLGTGPYGDVVHVKVEEAAGLDSPEPEPESSLGDLPAWIQELAEGWNRSAATEAELRYLREQISAVQSSLERQQDADSDMKTALDLAAKKAIAQAAHARLAADQAARLLEEQAATKQAQETAAREAAEAAAEARRLATELAEARELQASALEDVERAGRHALSSLEEAQENASETRLQAESATERALLAAQQVEQQAQQTIASVDHARLTLAREKDAIETDIRAAGQTIDAIVGAAREDVAKLSEESAVVAEAFVQEVTRATQEAQQTMAVLTNKAEALVEGSVDRLVEKQEAAAQEALEQMENLVAGSKNFVLQASAAAVADTVESARTAAREEISRKVAEAEGEISLRLEQVLEDITQRVNEAVLTADNATRTSLDAREAATSAVIEATEKSRAAVDAARVIAGEVARDEALQAAAAAGTQIEAQTERATARLDEATESSMEQLRQRSERSETELRERLQVALGELSGAEQRTKEAARIAAAHAAEGAVVREAQEQTAIAAAAAAQAARDAALHAANEAAARFKQSTAAQAARVAAEEARTMNEAAKEAIADSIERSRAHFAAQATAQETLESARRDVERATTTATEAVAKVESMIGDLRLEQEHFFQEHADTLKQAREAAKAAEGSARSAQASSWAAQKDAAHVARLAVDLGVGDAQDELTAQTAPEPAPVTVDDEAEEQPWQELAGGEEEGQQAFWAEEPSLQADDYLPEAGPSRSWIGRWLNKRIETDEPEDSV